MHMRFLRTCQHQNGVCGFGDRTRISRSRECEHKPFACDLTATWCWSMCMCARMCVCMCVHVCTCAHARTRVCMYAPSQKSKQNAYTHTRTRNIYSSRHKTHKNKQNSEPSAVKTEQVSPSLDEQGGETASTTLQDSSTTPPTVASPSASKDDAPAAEAKVCDVHVLHALSVHSTMCTHLYKALCSCVCASVMFMCVFATMTCFVAGVFFASATTVCVCVSVLPSHVNERSAK
jgi:hypothetical protein